MNTALQPHISTQPFPPRNACTLVSFWGAWIPYSFLSNISFGFHARRKTGFLGHQLGWLGVRSRGPAVLPNVLAMPAEVDRARVYISRRCALWNCGASPFCHYRKPCAGKYAGCLRFISTDNSSSPGKDRSSTGPAIRLWFEVRSAITVIDQAARFIAVFLFLPGVLGTASADTRCARHCRPSCFALVSLRVLRKAPAQRFRFHHKVPGLRLSRAQRKTLWSPGKARSPV